MNKMLKSIALAAVCLVAAFGQSTKPVIDNERVTVWDVKGQTIPARGHDRDTIVMSLVPSEAAMFYPRGAGLDDGGKAGRSLVIELKDHPVPPLENKTGYPLAFPRPHVKKLLENDRLIVWAYRWNPGEPTPMHFHDKVVVVVYLEDTALISTTPDGARKS